VAVLVALLAMAQGFRAALEETGRPDRAVVLRTGAADEVSSWLTMDELAVISEIDGLAAVSGELFTVADLITRQTGKPGVAIARGVSDAAFELRPELEIVAGRRFEAGRDEIIAGVGAAASYQGLDIGDRVRLRDHAWTVVGHFRGVGAHDSEVWLDLPSAQAAFRRTGAVSSLRVRLAQTATAQAVAERLQSDRRLQAGLVPEQAFYREQSRDRAQLIESFAWLVAGIMAVGSVIAAYSTMYSAVSVRSVEIATLRALGFRGGPIVASVLLEAMALSLLGALAGAAVTYLLYDGYAASTLNASMTQVAFQFAVTPELIGAGLAGALVLGFLGGLPPAVRCVRTSIAAALRGE